MDEFIEQRAKLVRWLADRADPFTKTRLLKLAEAYDDMTTGSDYRLIGLRISSGQKPL
jgi:hypothetical protein